MLKDECRFLFKILHVRITKFCTYDQKKSYYESLYKDYSAKSELKLKSFSQFIVKIHKRFVMLLLKLFICFI